MHSPVVYTRVCMHAVFKIKNALSQSGPVGPPGMTYIIVYYIIFKKTIGRYNAVIVYLLVLSSVY